MEPTNELAASVKESVTTIPKEKLHSDHGFSSVKVTSFTPDQITEACAKQVSSSIADGPTSEATKYIGRGLFSKAGLVLKSEDGRRQTVAIMTKSTGVPEVVRTSWPKYQNHTAENFFLSNEQRQTGDVREGLIQKADFAGLALKEDQSLDAEKSLQLHNLGAKVRLPLAGWQVDSFQVFDSQTNTYIDRDLRWFQENGYKGTELYQSAWGMSCPLRLEDVNNFLTHAVAGESVNIKAVDTFLDGMMTFAKADTSVEYQVLYKRWQDRLNKGTALDQAECANMLEDFGVALSMTMGKNYDVLHKNNLAHGNLHDQNISFFGELCDNSNVHEGTMKIGRAPENSQDIAGFRLALLKYGQIIAQLRGQDPFKQSVEVRQYVENTFYTSLRESWGSYADYCQKEWQEEIDNVVQLNRDSYTQRLMEVYGEATEREIQGMAVNALGGQEWPFGKS